MRFPPLKLTRTTRTNPLLDPAYLPRSTGTKHRVPRLQPYRNLPGGVRESLPGCRLGLCSTERRQRPKNDKREVCEAFLIVRRSCEAPTSAGRQPTHTALTTCPVAGQRASGLLRGSGERPKSRLNIARRTARVSPLPFPAPGALFLHAPAPAGHAICTTSILPADRSAVESPP